MSVVHFTSHELSTFAAIAYNLKLVEYNQLVPLCELISAGNCAAWAATYSDTVEPATADELERDILNALADPDSLVDRHFGPFAYNMIANNGRAFAGLTGGGVKELEQGADVLAIIRAIEKKCDDWQKAKRREKQRNEENAEAYDQVGQLPELPCEEIAERCKAAGCQRVIVAEFRVDESDGYTDYYGGRMVRRVVIGYGKGKRENFKQLRKAAGQFPPTVHLGPGRGRFSPCLRWDHNASEHPDRAFINFGKNHHPDAPRKDCYVHSRWWHDEYTGPDGMEFPTRDEAQAFIDSNEPLPGTYWDVSHDSYEHRETYSMGGGNYLGVGRYSGWQVSSFDVEYSRSGSLEVFEPETKTKRRRKAAPKRINLTKPTDPQQPRIEPRPKPRTCDQFTDCWLDWV